MVAGGLLVLQAGPRSAASNLAEQARANALAGTSSAMSRLLDQITTSLQRPAVVVVPVPQPPRPEAVWVPDRVVPVPGAPGVARVPGHWEHRVSHSEVYVPPLVIVDPHGGSAHVVPGGVRPPVEQRSGP